jgi:glyoxylase I family protein
MALQITGTHHVALCTPHFATLRSFYVDTLGLAVVGGFPGRTILFLDAGSTTIELIERNEPTHPTRQGFTHVAFQVADIDRAVDELTAKGITFHVLPKSFPEHQPSVRIAFFKDPDGNELELVQPLTAGYPQP